MEGTTERVFRESFATDLAALKDEVEIMSLPAWDSMAHMLFITQLEGGLNIQFTGDEIASMRTAGDLRRLVATKLNGR